MKQFDDLLRDVWVNGRSSDNRTAIGTRKVFGRQLRFNLAEGFPLVLSRQIYAKGAFVEMEFFLNGLTNIKMLNDNKVGIWDQWALTEEHIANYHGEGNPVVGDLGPIYGKQWRDWKISDNFSIDQIAELEKALRKTPNSRRLIVSAWNPADLPDESISPHDNVLNGKMALAACHTLFQLGVETATIKERFVEYLDRVHWSTLQAFYSTLYLKCASKDVMLSVMSPDEIAEARKGTDQEFEENTFLATCWREGSLVSAPCRFDTKKLHEALDKAGIPRQRINLHLFQRSLDLYLGGPFNISEYAVLLAAFANAHRMIAGDFVWSMSDVHIYNNQKDAVTEQLSRTSRTDLPKIVFKRQLESVLDFKHTDVEIVGYRPDAPIDKPAPAV